MWYVQIKKTVVMAQVVIFTISHLNAQPMYHNFVKTNVVIKLSIKSLFCLFFSDNFFIHGCFLDDNGENYSVVFFDCIKYFF